MRILYVAHRIPYPPDKGDKIRGWHFLQRLARRHPVDLACLADDRGDLGADRLRVLRGVCSRVEVVYRARPRALAASATAIPRGLPMSVPFFGDARLAAVVKEWISSRRYDAAIAHSAPMTQYVPRRAGMVRIADLCDVDSEKWRQYSTMASPPKKWIYAREAKRLRAWERDVARTWDHVVLATQPEAAIFRSFCEEGSVSVVPNGVDSTFFAPRAGGTPAKDVVLFTGAMDYFPNIEGVVWFAKEIWPLVRKEKPQARFVIVGPRPDESVVALADASKGIEVRGRIPDVRDALEESSVAVAPLRIARGIQNKVLEAMAFGKPAVTTTAAFEGIEAKPGRDLMIADEPAHFAATIVALLGDPGLRARIGESARRAVIASHSWDAHTATLESLLGRDASPQRWSLPYPTHADEARP